jgi:2-hydroxychromene-2-carboxylate isomerase
MGYMQMAKPVQYYYSAYSAYAYIGHQYFEKIVKDLGHHIDHRPFNLIKCVSSQPLSDTTEASLKYHFQRQRDQWSEFRNVEMPRQTPRSHSNAADLADRILIAGIFSDINIDQLAFKFMLSHWTRNADLTNENQIKEILISENFNAEELLKMASTKKIKDTYEQNTEKAIALSVFGSPTYFVDEDMFYAQDNLELVERALKRPFKKS